MRYKSRAKAALRALGLRRRRAPWVRAESPPAAAERLPSFGLYAIAVTWMEADVIGATVRNAFTQGCDRVLILDNDSPDDTIAAAKAAGAELAATFSTPELDEPLKIRLLNEIVAETSAASEHDHIWWLWLDADEFVHGPGGETVRAMVSALDRRFRIVGTRYINHYPDRRPEYLPGWHPLDFQPLGEERRGNLCSLGHRKHNLQRWDRAGPPMTCGLGFHAARELGDARRADSGHVHPPLPVPTRGGDPPAPRRPVHPRCGGPDARRPIRPPSAAQRRYRLRHE